MKSALMVWLASVIVRVTNAWCRVRLLQPHYAARRARGEPVRCLYAAWHCYLWHGASAMRGGDVSVLVSTHRDGELIARVLARLGYGLVRGSSTRGGAAALREITRVARSGQGDLVFTIDGPRGPAREVKDGILYAASRTGLPIVPVGMWVDRAWRAKSWDRLLIGKPLARVALVLGDELRIPPDVDHRELLQRYGPQLKQALDAAEAQARASLQPRPHAA